MSRIPLYTFFTELASYMESTSDLVGASPQYLQGIGASATESLPEVFNNFSDIRALMYLEWDDEAFGGDLSGRMFIKNIPYRYNPTDGKARLYLPVNTLNIPYTGVTSDVKRFRGEDKHSPVNVVVYRENPSTEITMAMILRNNKFAPWAGHMAYIVNRIRDRGGSLRLVVPRLRLDDFEGGKTDKSLLKLHEVRVRVTRFHLENVGVNRCAAVLSLLPNDQNLTLLTNMGIL